MNQAETSVRVGRSSTGFAPSPVVILVLAAPRRHFFFFFFFLLFNVLFVALSITDILFVMLKLTLT